MHRAIVIAGVSMVSAAAGAWAGYEFARNKLSKELDEILEEEIAKIKSEYRLTIKADYPTAKEAAEALLEDAAAAATNTEEISTEDLERVAKGLRYDNMFQGKVRDDLPAKVHDAVFGTPPEPRNEIIFAEVADEMDMTPEEPEEVSEVARVQAAAPKKTRPYAISRDDFFHSEDDYDQVQWTYFVGGAPGEETMIDAADNVVTDVHAMIGLSNLNRFGELSGDPNILYVRNDKLGLDFEIALHTGSAAETVAGFPDPRRRKPNRRQDADE